MYILEVSYGCPSEKYPLNGIFQMDQAKALSDLGHKIIFAAVDVRSARKWRRWGITQRTKNGIPVFEFNFPMGPILPGVRESICKVGFSMLLRKVVAQYGKPDVVHAHFGGTALSVVETCKREGIPYVVTEHSSGVNRDDLTEAEIAPMRYVYQNAAAVIAVSGALARRVERYSGVVPTVIPNIIDFTSFSCKKEPHDTFRFIAAGSLKNGKGFDIAIRAFSIFISRGYHANFLIMGDGPERENLMRLVREYHLDENVSFFGKYVRPQFAEELSKSDAFVLASRGETFGVVYAEAMACGVPVIATRCGGPEDFVNETNGIMVDVDDVNGLACAMMEIYSASGTYDANLISELTKKQFSSKLVAEEISLVLGECLNENKS